MQKNFIVILLLFGLIFLNGTTLALNRLYIAFWLEPMQLKELSDDIASTLKEIEMLQLEIEIRDYVIVLGADQSSNDLAMKQFCEMLSSGESEGVSVVLDLTYQAWMSGLEVVNELHIPYLRVAPLMVPFLRVFADFLRQKDANDVALIFQNEQDKLETLYHTVEGFPFRTLLLNARDDSKFAQRLKKLRPSPSYFAIFARGSNMNIIFEKLQKGQLFERAAEWHFIFLDARERVFKYKKQVEFATKFTVNGKLLCRALQMKDSYCVSGFTFQRGMLLSILRTLINVQHINSNWLQPLRTDGNCDYNLTEAVMLSSATTAVQSIDLLQFFDMHSFITLDFGNDFNADEENEFVNQLPLLSYTLNISINSYSNEHEAKTDLAIWQLGKLEKINKTISAAKRFFRISVTEAMPWSYYRRNRRTGELILDYRGEPIWEGYCIDFINTLAEKMQFNYALVAPSKGKYGKRDPKTGQWDGIVGDLVSGETDFAVSALKMYSEREEYIDYIAPYYEQTGISIVMRKPVRQTSLFKFMTVLRTEVWLSIIAALFVTAIMIWLLDKYSPYSSRNNHRAYPYPCRIFTLRESIWFALTSFTPQGGGEAPKAISGRILVAAYWLFVVLMLATFTANLAAFLTVERMQTPVASLEQLARQSRINYTVIMGSDTHQYFMNMKFAEDTLYRMWKELSLNASADYHKYRVWDYPIKEQYGHILLSINDSGPVRDAKEGFHKVEISNADFAFIHDSSEIKYEIANRNCNLTEVGEVFAEQPYAIAVQQGSHLADEFSFAILELQKERYFEELRAKYWNHSQLNCPLSDDQEGISLQSLGGVFIATLFGLGLAMLTLTIEVVYYQKKESHGSELSSNNLKVKPIVPGPSAPIRDAWTVDNDIGNINIRQDIKITPPPSFEVATSRVLHIPPGIILGSENFQLPKERKVTSLRDMDSGLSPYIE